MSPGTINHGLKIVRRILNLAATEWVDQHGLTWLLTSPKIKLLLDVDRRQQLGTPVFIIPGERVKNGDERPVVLNRVASSVVAARRGIDPVHVFTFEGHPITRKLTSGW